MSIITKKPLVYIAATAGIALFICVMVSTEMFMFGLILPTFGDYYKVAAQTTVFSVSGMFILIAGLGWRSLTYRGRILSIALSLILCMFIYGAILQVNNYELISVPDTSSINQTAFDCVNVLPCETKHKRISNCICKDDSLRLNKNILASLKYDRFGHAFIFADSQWMMIDKEGAIHLSGIIAVDNGPDDPSNNRIRFRQNGKWGYANANGIIMIPATYDGAMPFENGVASVCIGCNVKYEGEYMLFDGGRRFSIDTLGNMM
jgi:hypothetical protein